MALDTFNPAVPPTSGNDKPEIRIRKAQFGDGYTQRTPDGLNHIKQTASLEWDCLTPSQANAITAFLAAHTATPFLYTTADSGVQRKWVVIDWTRGRGTPITLSVNIEEDFSLVS